MNIILGHRVPFESGLDSLPNWDRRKKMFFKRGGNRRGFFKTGEISSHTFFCLSVPCVECPSFSDYRRSMRVCVCVCIIALSHGLTWFLNEKKTNPLILLLLTESLLKVLSYLFSEKLFFIFFLLLLFVSQGEFGLIGIYHHTPSGCWVSALCVYSAIWRNGCFRWPCSFFFLSLDDVEVLGISSKQPEKLVEPVSFLCQPLALVLTFVSHRPIAKRGGRWNSESSSSSRNKRERREMKVPY